jgi:type I restriction enzyme M protein
VARERGDAELAQLRQAAAAVRGITRTTDFGTIALIMVFVRATRETVWSDWRGSDGRDARELFWYLEDELDLRDDATTRIIRDLPEIAIAEIIDVVDSTARRLGNVAAFRLILEEFASDGDILTPESIAIIIANAVDMASAVTIHDPFCRAGELLVAAATQARENLPGAVVFSYGDMPDSRSLAIARMNMRLHQVDGILERRSIRELTSNRSNDLAFSRIVANPPFNVKAWTHHGYGYWRYGEPPKNNANFAWLQYAVERLEPGGKAAVIMPNGAGTTASPRERDIRMRMVEDGCVEALISLPPALFRGTGVAATIWLLSPPGTSRDEILFIDASHTGHMVSRTLRELDESEIRQIVQTVKNWRSGLSIERIDSDSGISSVAVSLPQLRERDYSLSPSAFMTRPYASSSRDVAMPRIRQLVDKLEAEQAVASAADIIAAHTVRNLTR